MPKPRHSPRDGTRMTKSSCQGNPSERCFASKVGMDDRAACLERNAAAPSRPFVAPILRVSARHFLRSATPWLGVLLLSGAPLLILSRFPVTATASPAQREPEGLTMADVEHPAAIVVTSVRTGGPAERGGIRVGDRVRAIDGQRLSSHRTARQWLQASSDCRLRFDLVRDGAPIVATVDRCATSEDDGKDTGR